MDKKFVVAHRGASAYAPESTLEAFQKAIDMGADMVEFDVRRAKDGVLVINHNPDYKGQRIADLTLGELKELSQGQVPTLEEVLRFTANKIKLDVELKESGYEDEVVNTINSYIKSADYIISSSKIPSIKYVKRKYPFIRAGIILRKRDLFKAYKASRKYNYPDLFIVHKSLAKMFFWSNKKNNKPVWVWTVDGQKRIMDCYKNGKVECVITNQPDVAVKVRNEMF